MKLFDRIDLDGIAKSRMRMSPDKLAKTSLFPSLSKFFIKSTPKQRVKFSDIEELKSKIKLKEYVMPKKQESSSKISLKTISDNQKPPKIESSLNPMSM